MVGPIFKALLSSLLLALFISGCAEKRPETALEKPPGTLDIDFIFSRAEYSVGEAVCLRITLINSTSDTVSLDDYPMKSLSLSSPSGDSVTEYRRTGYPKPPRMMLFPGDSSFDEVNLTGIYENLGPGMLSAGKYRVKTRITYYTGRQVVIRTKCEGFSDSADFTIVEPEGKALEAKRLYFNAMSEIGLDNLVGRPRQDLPQSVTKQLGKLVERYPFTPIGQRILVDDLGIWRKKASLEDYARFIAEAPTDCPCCLHRWAIDRMIQRYVLTGEREAILDIAESGLIAHPRGTPVGDYLRRAFSFRMEGDKLIR